MRNSHLPGAAEAVDERVVGDDVRRAPEPRHLLEEPEPLVHHGIEAEPANQNVEGADVGGDAVVLAHLPVDLEGQLGAAAAEEDGEDGVEGVDGAGDAEAGHDAEGEDGGAEEAGAGEGEGEGVEESVGEERGG